MIVFIDTEVNPQTKKVADYEAVREDGAVMHSHSKAEFDAFVSKCETICGGDRGQVPVTFVGVYNHFFYTKQY